MDYYIKQSITEGERPMNHYTKQAIPDSAIPRITASIPADNGVDTLEWQYACRIAGKITAERMRRACIARARAAARLGDTLSIGQIMRDVARAQKKRMSDAAPELLAALELLLRATQDGNHITGVVIAQAQAAVRKARGL